jgi:hypothetical protein
MAKTLSTQVLVELKATLSDTVGMAAETAVAQALASFTLASGTGANQGDMVYTTSATITTGATLSIDVKAALTDAFGAAYTPAKLKLIYIASKAANTTNLTILGNAASVPILSAATTTATLTPGDVFLITRRAAAGIAVTAATGDIIDIVNAAGASAVVDVILVGTSA